MKLLPAKKSNGVVSKLQTLGIRLWDQVEGAQHNPLDSDFSRISSGSYLLDQALGTGGWPAGRIIEIFGTDSSGKSTLALHAIAEAQAEGKVCVYMDLENTLNQVWAEKIGVKTDQLYICNPSSGEETFEIMNSLVKSNEADLIVIDSVASMVPEAELDATLADQAVGLQARLMSKGLRILQSHLIGSKATIMFINQVREQIKQTYFPSTTTTGGRALKYAASIRVEVKRQEAIKNNEKIIGFLTKIIVVKNKFNSPMLQVPLRLYFDSGFNKTAEVIDAAIEKKLIEKKGAWFYYKDKNVGQGLTSLRDKFLNDEFKEEFQELKEKLFPDVS
ncbi:recombinase A [Candidatus Mycoplasma haematolamae str. Purdue]|uniref:Protein RecA n=1 Tax=Mycoplasma haematolamae (strain Purdue) TaxID=1212765 RepID=I7C7D1_MYCHA|nr:recombinase RecA [Candidatus Mycoplasma haematolamae]AFO52437.1 recombinase A [Candidatus Mycoplasma haematolamae str. Purdue]